MNAKHVVALATFTATATAFAAPVVDDVTMTQDAASRRVTVTYKLTDEPAIVTLDVRTNGVSIGAENIQTLGGDVNKVVRDLGTTRTILWQPNADWPNRKIKDGTVTAVVTAWATNCPPPYMAADLRSDNAGDVLNFYPCAEAVPDGVTNDVYKTTKLLMRKIPAALVKWYQGAVVASDYNGMGLYWYNTNWKYYDKELRHKVTLTEDYYIGVYPFTQGQYKTLYCVTTCSSEFNGYDDSDLRPYSKISYAAIRGASNGSNWPDVRTIDAESLLDVLRTRTDVPHFDLPTEAQWEFAGRAGVGKCYYNGKDFWGSAGSGSIIADRNLESLAWYAQNSASNTTDNIQQTHPVGQKLPNGFGLYDMLGNVCELVLDVWTTYATTDDLTDPVGPARSANSFNTRCGGSYASEAKDCRVATRTWSDKPANAGSGWGFRLCCKPLFH